MLSISTGKNQSLKIRGALQIPTYEYNYKVITGCDTILQEYYITDRHKCENIKRYTIKNCIKGAHESQRENSRAEQGGLEGWGFKRSANNSRFRCVTLISNWEKNKLLALRSGHEDPGELELPNEWHGERELMTRAYQEFLVEDQQLQ